LHPGAGYRNTDRWKYFRPGQRIRPGFLEAVNSPVEIQRMFKKVMLVVSPVSRPRWVARYIPEVQGILEGAGIEVDLHFTRGPGDPARLAKEAEGCCDAVIMAGGDGSINETMNALFGSPLPVGIIPLGTVNVFAREMGIPLRPPEAARAFLKSTVKTFDMGRIGKRRFLLMASYGFDVQGMRKNPALLKKIFGRYSYVITCLSLIPFYRDREIEVFLDGEDAPPVRATFAVFSNSKYYAGNYIVAPEADMQDGLLDLTLFRCPGRLGLFKIFFSFIRGNHLSKPWVRTGRTDRVRFKAADPKLFQIDGDPLDPTENEIAVDKNAIRVVVPEK